MHMRLDETMVKKGMVSTRSQASSFIRMGKVVVDDKPAKKPGQFVSSEAKIKLKVENKYVSRAAYKLESAVRALHLEFTGKTILDVGSSTGGFTDYALQHGANKSIAVDVGTEQLHPTLRGDERIELHEKTDIRDIKKLNEKVDIVVIDVSFISLRMILNHVAKLAPKSQIVAMCKPQFEAGPSSLSAGVVKNDTERRRILKQFEQWLSRNGFLVKDKADSGVAGEKGNVERFYLLIK